MLHSRRAIIALAILAFAAVASSSYGQTDVWVGGFPDSNFSNLSNWTSGTVPVNDGSETLDFDDDSGSDLNLNIPPNFKEAQLQDLEGASLNTSIIGTQLLTPGAGGIQLAATEDGQNSLTLNIPVHLSASQGWSGGNGTVNGAIMGPGAFSQTGGFDVLSLAMVARRRRARPTL